MSLFVLSPETVWNPAILDFPTAPRKIFQRGLVLPRRDASPRLIARAALESLFLRCVIALLPFPLAMIAWPATSMPISAAPIAMLAAVGLVELRVFRRPAHKRHEDVGDAAARTLDMLAYRGRRILSDHAARRGIESGTLYLVIEQSDLTRLPPLTLASVQRDQGRSRLVALTAEERGMIRDGLFDDDLTEQQLLHANAEEGVFLRSVSFDARGVSAHARLDALLATTDPAEGASA